MKPPRIKSLAIRMTLQLTAATLILLLIFWLVLYTSVQRGFIRQDEEIFEDRLRTIQNLLENEDEDPVQVKKRVEQEWAMRKFERVYVRILNSKGEIVTQTPRADMASLFEQIPLEGVGGKAFGRYERNGETFIYASRQFSVFGSKSGVYRVQMALDRTSEAQLLVRLRESLAIFGVFGVLVCLWSATLIVRTGLRPIHDISSMAARVNSTSFKERLALESFPSEFHDLAITFNKMLDRLQASFERLTRFSDDMAHELRTPVNNLLGVFGVTLSRPRTAAEYETALSSGIEEGERLKRIIDALLFLARAKDPSLEVNRQDLVLQHELKEILGFYETSAQEAGVELNLDVNADLRINAERTLFQRAIGNLISNSIRHSSRGGRVFVRAVPLAERIAVEVRDEGCGIGPEDLPHLGERLFRVDTSRSKTSGGLGLGLSIVKGIAHLHGGQLKIASSVGRGTSVEIDFPVSKIS